MLSLHSRESMDRADVEPAADDVSASTSRRIGRLVEQTPVAG